MAPAPTATCMGCLLPTQLSDLDSEIKAKEDRVMGLFGIQHLENDSREGSRAFWSDHYSKREQGSPKLTSVNTLLYPPLKIAQSSLIVFSRCSQYTPV